MVPFWLPSWLASTLLDASTAPARMTNAPPSWTVLDEFLQKQGMLGSSTLGPALAGGCSGYRPRPERSGVLRPAQLRLRRPCSAECRKVLGGWPPAGRG